jgi:glycogen debranching enzyme
MSKHASRPMKGQHPSRAEREDGHRTAHERKQRVLTHGSPSGVASIAGAVVVKDGDLFFLSDSLGRVPVSGRHGFGLYYHDCRFLNGYELHFGDTLPDVLASTAEQGYSALFELANQVVPLGDGKTLPKERVAVRWMRVADGKALAVHEVLTFRNYGVSHVDLPVSFHFGSNFEDVFIVRGLIAEELGTVHPPRWTDDGVLHFLYDGSDGVHRGLSIHLSPAPRRTDGSMGCFDLSLDSQETREIHISLAVAESKDADEVKPRARQAGDPERVAESLRGSQREWLEEHAEVSSDDPHLDHVIRRSMMDLRMLRTRLRDREFFAAGIPWFVTLFGRDSIITALQTLAYDHTIAEQTLRLLASYQGSEVNDLKDEQPGKIPHELRVGELATRGSIPYTPYYGSVDATPLFLVLLGRQARWSGDLSLFHSLRDNVERALKWIAEYGDADGDGYVEYESGTEHGLVNQGWKDSGDAIVNADGSLARPPIALVEVQGYVYLAKMEMADLHQRAGEADRAAQLRKEAAALRERFNRDFWLQDRGFYALALQKDDAPCAVLTSNPGHALWTGIADEEKAGMTVEKLVGDDMFSGYGVRTLSTSERRYNPVGYHLGTVWPHDNSILAAGFRRYGFDREALGIFDGVRDAATHFSHLRLPEVFAGYPREAFGTPVHYPVACHPQAWAAGAIPFLLQTLLGLEPDAFEGRLRVVRPILPERVRTLEIRNTRVGKGCVDLRFRNRDGGTDVEVLAAAGVDVVVDDG